MEQETLQDIQDQIEGLRRARAEIEADLEQKRMQRRAMALIDSMPDVYYQTDMNGKLLFISPSCEQQTGYGTEELIGRNVAEFYADPAQRQALLVQLQAHGMVNDYTVKLVHKDGQPRYASVTGRLIYDGSRQPIGIEGILRNITRRRMAEKALEASEARMRTLFESASDYALVLALQESGPPIIVDANEAAFERFGYTREEMIGQPVTRFETAASAAKAHERAKSVRKGGLIHFEVEHQCRDGSTFMSRVSAKMVPDGESALLFTVEQDITKLKRVEAQQSRLLDENRRLMRNIMRVQEEERRLLARDLHDELGQLLTSIDTNAAYIVKYADNEDIRTTADQICRNAQSAFGASHDVLLKLRPTTLDTLGLQAALQELVDYWRQRAGIECKLHIDGELDDYSDTSAITVYRLMQEGLTNAFRHGKATVVDVSLRIRADTVYLEINDNGQGAHIETMASGIGIIGMRERVHALGGVFMLTDLPTDGVRVEARIPLQGYREEP